MKEIIYLCAAIFAIEILVFVGVSIYDLALLNQVRTSIVVRVITGVDMFAPIVSSIVNAWATR